MGDSALPGNCQSLYTASLVTLIFCGVSICFYLTVPKRRRSVVYIRYGNPNDKIAKTDQYSREITRNKTAWTRQTHSQHLPRYGLRDNAVKNYSLKFGKTVSVLGSSSEDYIRNVRKRRWEYGRRVKDQWRVISLFTMNRLSLILFPTFHYFVSIYWNMMYDLRHF
jgi:hypothetical protein